MSGCPRCTELEAQLAVARKNADYFEHKLAETYTKDDGLSARLQEERREGIADERSAVLGLLRAQAAHLEGTTGMIMGGVANALRGLIRSIEDEEHRR